MIAAGILCRERLMEDLPAGAIYVLGDDCEGVIRKWSEFALTVNLRGRGVLPKASIGMRVVEVRIIKQARPVPMGDPSDG